MLHLHRKVRRWVLPAALLMLIVTVMGVPHAAKAAGSWTTLSPPSGQSASTMFLLTDGSVMLQGGNGSRTFMRLSPDQYGNYLNPQWSTPASMPESRLYYASSVLRDGRLLVAGGEYSDAGSETNTADIYDPVANVWFPLTQSPGFSQIGDSPCKLLSDGRFMLCQLQTSQIAVYDPLANSWASVASSHAANSEEESWSLLPDQSVLTVHCTSATNSADRFVPGLNQWVSAGTPPVQLVNTNLLEIGPSLLLPDGRCFYVGGTGNTALYTPPANPTDSGRWQAGPTFPNGWGASDAPACLEPNGKVLCSVGAVDTTSNNGNKGYNFSSGFFEYDPSTNGLTSVPLPPNNNGYTYYGRMLLLPTGQILFSNNGTSIAVYTPSGSANPSWAPTVQNVSINGDGTYQVTGTQFNGLSEGASYGDDASVSTNYPLVRIQQNVSNGRVWYARTFNHSTMGVATGSAIVSTNFELPLGLDVSQPLVLSVVANGIASAPTPFYPSAWRAISVATGPDGNAHILWDRTDGQISLWTVNPQGQILRKDFFGPFNNGSSGKAIAVDSGNNRILWDRPDGAIYLWNVDTGGNITFNQLYGPFNNGSLGKAIAVDSNGNSRVLWDRADGAIYLWNVNPSGNITLDQLYGPYNNGSAGQAVSVDPRNGNTRILWDQNGGSTYLWTVDPNGNKIVSVEQHYGSFNNGTTGMGISTGADGNTYVLWDSVLDSNSSVSGQAFLWLRDPIGNSLLNQGYGPFY